MTADLERMALLERQGELETVEEMVFRGRVESSTLPERLELLASQARLDPWAGLAILEERADLVSNFVILYCSGRFDLILCFFR